MWTKIKRMKRIWDLSEKDPEYLKAIEGLSQKDVDAIPKGNGKASFIPLMTESERDAYLKEQEPMWKKFNARLKEIMK